MWFSGINFCIVSVFRAFHRPCSITHAFCLGVSGVVSQRFCLHAKNTSGLESGLIST